MQGEVDDEPNEARLDEQEALEDYDIEGDVLEVDALEEDGLEREEFDGDVLEDDCLQEEDSKDEAGKVTAPKRRRLKPIRNSLAQGEEQSSQDSADIFDQSYIIDRLPSDRNKLNSLLSQVNRKIRSYKLQFLREEQSSENRRSFVGEQSVPICADVTKFDFGLLMSKMQEIGLRQFDVIMMDPPWRLSSSQPSRGVAIQYCSLPDEAIEQIPLSQLQQGGFLFVWVINAKFQWTVRTMQQKWGYKVVDSINWVKKTVNGRIAKGHGFYLQHAKQACLVGYKGDFKHCTNHVASDVIFSYRRGQSQKPTEIYEYIESLVPHGYYLEIFGRRNNLRNRWTTIGNEL